MSERTATIARFNPETSKFFIIKRKKTAGLPSKTETVDVGEMLAFNSDKPRYKEFGLAMIWQGQKNVFAIFRPESNLFYRINGQEEAKLLRATDQHQIPIPEKGIRVINPKTKEQLDIRLNKPEEDIAIGAKPIGPDPSLSESVALTIPK